jgi:hypothetical protein
MVVCDKCGEEIEWYAGEEVLVNEDPKNNIITHLTYRVEVSKRGDSSRCDLCFKCSIKNIIRVLQIEV